MRLIKVNLLIYMSINKIFSATTTVITNHARVETTGADE